MFTGAELCNRLPPGRDPEGGLCEGQAGVWGQVNPQGTLQAILADHRQYRL